MPFSPLARGALPLSTSLWDDHADANGNEPSLRQPSDGKRGLRAKLCNQASYVSLVASVHRSFLDAPNSRAPTIDVESAGSMCDTPQARHSKTYKSGKSPNRDVTRASRMTCAQAGQCGDAGAHLSES